MIAPLPKNELARLQALADLKILDTSDDPYFQNAVTLASKILRAPISLVSLVDANRQWFKAIVGLPVRETPRDVAFCAHAILQNDVFVVPDATKDERFCENPLVTGSPFIRSYAGAPLIDSNGNALGTLCVISPVMTGWSADELATLSTLAEMVVKHLETLRFAQGAAERDALAKELARVETLHQSIVTSMAEGVVVQSRDGAIKVANPAAAKILGMSIDQLQGRTSHDPKWRSVREDGSPFPGDLHPAMIALRTGQPVDDVVMGVGDPDVERRWIKINARPLFAPGCDDPNEVVVTFSDITKKVSALSALARKSQRLAMALDVGSIGVIERDKASGRVTMSGSAEALSVFGPIPETKESPLATLISPQHQPGVLAAWDQHLSGGPRIKIEVPLKSRDGSERWALLAAEKLVDAQGNHSGALIAVKDIHQRKLSEFALVESMQKLECASRAKDIFLANMGHEIRTPLNGVMGMTTALVRTNLSAEQREMVSLIQSSGEVLDRILSDVLDAAKLESGKLELKNAPFDLRRAIEDASLLMAIRADEKGLSFTVEASAAVEGQWVGDSVRIKQIVTNLVSNAIKFTAKGGVVLRLYATSATGHSATDWVSIEVEDTGIGIADDAQKRIFERFEQADKSIVTNFGGTGLGLSICRSLTNVMGGEISVSSQIGSGSKFTVRIPMMRASEDTAQPPTELADWSMDPNPSKRKSGLMNILLVDDHPTNQKVVEAMLKAFDCTVVCASNGHEAFEKCQLGQFDLILMDMAMPVMDGLEATRKVRAWEAASQRRRTPISMLTAFTGDRAIHDARTAGADFHIAKPVTPQSLLAGLEKAMHAARRVSDAA